MTTTLMARRAARGALALGIVAALSTLATPASADPRDEEWWLAALRIDEAQQLTRGEGVTVGVLDTPVDAKHPDLQGRVLRGSGFTRSDPAHGWASGEPASHGTGMAGLIAGNGPGDHGYRGVAPGASILPYGSVSREGRYLAAGIRWLTDHGARVINISQVTTVDSAEDIQAVRYAMAHDVVVVAATGNVEPYGKKVTFPARIRGVVAVSGTTPTGDAWAGSSSGPEVVVAAPATEMVLPAPYGFSPEGYDIAKGTSDAAAIVSGVAALVRAKYPTLNAASVINRLITTAADKGAPGHDNWYGFGMIQPYEALTADVPTVDTNPLLGPAAAVKRVAPKATPAATASPSAPAPTPTPAAAKPASAGSSIAPWILGISGCLLVITLVVLAVIIVMRRRKRYGNSLSTATE